MLLPLSMVLIGCSGPVDGTTSPIRHEDDEDDSGTVPIDSGDTAPIDTDETDTDSGAPSNDPRDWPTIATGLPLADIAGANVLLIHTDTLRSDYLSTYDSVFDTLPTIKDEPWLVVGGLVSSGNWTPTATASLFTGLTPQRHNVRYLAPDKGVANADIPIGITMSDSFRRAGYRTALFTGNSLLEAELTGQTGFELLDQSPKHAGQSNAGVLVDHALTWLDELGDDDRFFAVIQAMDAHDPFSADNEDEGAFVEAAAIPFDLDHDGYVYPYEINAVIAEVSDEQERAELTGIARALYAEQILGVDRATARMLDYLRAEGKLDNTVVLFLGDHGETLNDRDNNAFGHGTTLEPQLVSLPLMILAPGTAPGSIWCTAENADIAPTLLRSVGLPPLEAIDGAELQGGCRPWARSSWYEDATGALLQVTATGKDAQVTHNCTDGATLISNLRVDPLGRAVGDPSIAGDAPALLDEYIKDIHDHIPTEYCD